MSDDPYWIQFLLDAPPPVSAVVDRCLAAGLATTPDGDTAVATRYTVDGERVRHDEGDSAPEDGGDPLDDVVEAVAAAEMGSLQFWDDTGMALRVAVSNGGGDDWTAPTLLLDVATLALDLDSVPEERVAERIDTIVDVTAALAAVTDAEYAWGSRRVGQDPDAGLRPTGRPIGEHVDSLSWLTVFSASVLATFEGRRAALSDAWRVERLPSGHVVRVDRPHPRYGPESTPDSYRALLRSRSE